MSRARSKPRRDARYQAAVRRQIAMHAERPNWYAPVEEFLRPGDTADMFRDDATEEA